ncbi:MAG: ABC transporter permease, partial [bacterium]|nr:ABC transporter permease [bacterium]
MPLLVHYSFKSIFTRKMTSILTIAGLALVVFVFAASFMLSHGLRETLVSTGYDENVMAVRKGATAET